ncbi:hypothetical protein GCM10027589_17290 [Actinocorallia lasiicapitis]
MRSKTGLEEQAFIDLGAFEMKRDLTRIVEPGGTKCEEPADARAEHPELTIDHTSVHKERTADGCATHDNSLLARPMDQRVLESYGATDLRSGQIDLPSGKKPSI